MHLIIEIMKEGREKTQNEKKKVWMEEGIGREKGRKEIHLFKFNEHLTKSHTSDLIFDFSSAHSLFICIEPCPYSSTGIIFPEPHKSEPSSIAITS